MPLLSKAGSILRQTANRQIKSELSIHQAIRCTSSMASSEALRGTSYQTDQQSLRKAFAKSGEVDGKTFMDRDTGRSRGLGFITSSAIQPLGGQELHGRQVRLNYSTDRPRSNFGSCYGGYTGGVVGYYGQHGSGYGFGVGYGLRYYGGGSGDKFLSTGNSSNYGPGAGVGSAVNSTIGNSTIGSADKFGFGQRNSFSSGATGNTGGGYEIAYTRSGASTADEHGILPNTLRPLSPHLPVYKPQINSTRSILDRIAASYLTAIILLYYLVCVKMGSICFTFEYFHKFLFYSANLVPLSLELSAVAMAYHTYYGIGHLLNDFKGFRFLRFGK
ncbi:glycine-rich RNA-binding protein 3, mitochondrial-like [Rosa sericea]